MSFSQLPAVKMTQTKLGPSYSVKALESSRIALRYIRKHNLRFIYYEFFCTFAAVVQQFNPQFLVLFKDY